MPELAASSQNHNHGHADVVQTKQHGPVSSLRQVQSDKYDAENFSRKI